MTEPLSKDWIQELWRLWSRIRKSRKNELTEITSTFGNPELLARTYTEPDCQRTNPADHHEDEPQRTFRQPIRQWLNGFLSGEFFERDGRNTLFVLSDAGMGKSSLLMMLKLTHLMSFWPNGLSFRLEKLGDNTLDAIGQAGRQNKTILLLDALDEDPEAWGQIEQRLSVLLHATQGFRQVILTCRTQFFPEGGQKPIESPEKVEVAGFVCNMLYLSPFSDTQVEAYLRKRFQNSWWMRLLKLVTGRDNRKLERARALLGPMRSLRMRPMLLAYIDILMDANLTTLTEYSVYSALVDEWLLREERKEPGGPTREALHQACLAVAMHLQRTGDRKLDADALKALLERDPEAELIKTIDVGGRSLLNLTSDPSYRFAHYSVQEFLVARYFVEGERPQERAGLRATDQLLRFLFSWAAEDPKERLGRVLTDGLAVDDIQRVGSVGLEGQDLQRVEMPIFLRGIDLSGSDLRWANLQDSDLRNADLRNADLRNADLRGADLRGVNFEKATLGSYALDGARVDPIERKGVVLVLVSGGEYSLGQGSEQHQVALSPFWIGKYPVTNAQYQAFLTENPGHQKPEFWGDKQFNEPEQPVVGVSWLDAMAYCAWAGFDLPSEAQWEAAARGPEGRIYPWGDQEPNAELANYDGREDRPTPVGTYPKGAGPYGTLDQAGNVWEWCRDTFYSTAYQGRNGQRDPVAPELDEPDKSIIERVRRGGSWSGDAGDLPAAVRFRNGAGRRYQDFGFRVVCGSVPEP